MERSLPVGEVSSRDEVAIARLHVPARREVRLVGRVRRMIASVRRGALLLSLAPVAFGCIHGTTALRGYPLYAADGVTRLPGGEVAQLTVSMPVGASPGGGASAFITSIDGRDVSTLDSAFELRPGCHVVQTSNSFLVATENIRWSGNIGTRVFPFRMKAGFEYSVIVELIESLGGGRVSVSSVERDPSGAQTQVIEPATSPLDEQACRTWSRSGL